MPDLRLTSIVVWKNRRVVKIGSPTNRASPCPITIKNDEHDISDTANSAKCNCRQNSSDGCSTVGIRSMPSTFTVPSRIGQVRGLLVIPMLSWRFIKLFPGRRLRPAVAIIPARAGIQVLGPRFRTSGLGCDQYRYGAMSSSGKAENICGGLVGAAAWI